jgi:hypothetical protein
MPETGNLTDTFIVLGGPDSQQRCIRAVTDNG